MNPLVGFVQVFFWECPGNYPDDDGRTRHRIAGFPLQTLEKPIGMIGRKGEQVGL